MTEDLNTKMDRFYRETSVWPPGRDRPAAFGDVDEVYSTTAHHLWKVWCAKEKELEKLRSERDAADLRVRMLESSISMTVARLGGEVEGRPTHRLNFLQRVDELRNIEAKYGRLLDRVAILASRIDALESE